LPQRPQCDGLVVSGTHEPAHRTFEPVQPELQLIVPGLQYGRVTGQTLPHAPQLFGSTSRSAQVEPQLTRPDSHEHAPATQGRPPGQTLPHMPQLRLSVSASTHVPPQSMRPPGQAHIPLTQPRPAGQTLPHAPQLRGSVRASVQFTPQKICDGIAQPETHIPSGLHIGVPPAQTFPQRPQ
jgi:hypothetical protein